MPRIWTLSFPLLMLAALCTAAGPWTLTPLAKPVRGVGYQEAVIVDGVVVFMQLGTDSGIKQWDNGNVTTLVPGRAETPIIGNHFMGLSSISFDGARVAFIGHTDLIGKGHYERVDGVYTWDAGKLNHIADSRMDIPGKPDAKFRYFHHTSIGGSLVAFEATDTTAAPGVYGVDENGLRTVAIGTKPPPGGRGSYTQVGGGFIGNGAVIYQSMAVADPGHFVESVYADRNGKVTTLLDTTQNFPPVGKFISFDLSSVDGLDFAGNGGFGRTGTYFKVVKGRPTAVVSMSQPLPGEGERPNAIENGTIKDGYVLCIAGRNARRVLLSDAGGTLAKLMATGETLDGKPIGSFQLSRQAFDGKRAVITVMFKDMSSMIYLATAPANTAVVPSKRPTPKN